MEILAKDQKGSVTPKADITFVVSSVTSFALVSPNSLLNHSANRTRCPNHSQTEPPSG